MIVQRIRNADEVSPAVIVKGHRVVQRVSNSCQQIKRGFVCKGGGDSFRSSNPGRIRLCKLPGIDL